MNEAASEVLFQLCSENPRELVRLCADLPARGEEGVLLYLSRQDRMLLSGELTAASGLGIGRVANILRQLEEKGQILRVSDRRDKRRVYVSLTPEGRRQAERLRQAAVARIEGLTAYLGAEDSAPLFRLFSRCLDYYRQE